MEEHHFGGPAGGDRRLCHAHRQDRQDGEHWYVAGFRHGVRIDYRSPHQIARPAEAISDAGDLLGGRLPIVPALASWPMAT